MSDKRTIHTQTGMTLIELSVVLLVLVALAGLVVPYVAGTSGRAACITTEASMVAIRNAIVGNFENPGYFHDMGRYPNELSELYVQGTQSDFNPITKQGWRGPYLLSSAAGFNATGNFADTDYVNTVIATTDPVIFDGYINPLNPIIIQLPEDSIDNNCSDIDVNYAEQDCTRIVSAGADGILDTKLEDADGDTRNDDHVLYLSISDPNASLNQSCTE